MKRVEKFCLLAFSVLLLAGCNENQSSKRDIESIQPVLSTATEDVKDKSFNELFTSIEPTQITGNVFSLVGEDYTVITAGEEANFNSMVASFGGWGILFNKPVTWCFLRASRYTLEIMKEHNSYTMTYFEEIHKDEFMKFGMISGRDSEKMKNTKLTPVQTPSGNPTYKEAKLILECTLTEITTVSPDDYLTEEGRKFVIEGFEDAKEYHKLVFGDITKVWVRK